MSGRRTDRPIGRARGRPRVASPAEQGARGGKATDRRRGARTKARGRSSRRAGRRFTCEKRGVERLPEVREPIAASFARRASPFGAGGSLGFLSRANRGDKVGLCAPCDLSSTGCRAVGLCRARRSRRRLGSAEDEKSLSANGACGLPKPPPGGRGKRHFVPIASSRRFPQNIPQNRIDFVLQNARSSPRSFSRNDFGRGRGDRAPFTAASSRRYPRLGERKQRCPSSRGSCSSPTTVTSRARSTSPTKSSSSEGTSDGPGDARTKRSRRGTRALPVDRAMTDPRRVAFPSSSPPQAKRVRRAPQVRRHLAQARHPRGAGERFGACPPRIFSFPPLGRAVEARPDATARPSQTS